MDDVTIHDAAKPALARTVRDLRERYRHELLSPGERELVRERLLEARRELRRLEALEAKLSEARRSR